MKNGAQNVIKIHEKWTLGRPWVDFLTPWVDFGGCRKFMDFLIALGSAKKREKWSQGSPKGRPRGLRRFAGATASAAGASGRPRAVQFYSRIEGTLECLQWLHHAIGLRPGELYFH